MMRLKLSNIEPKSSFYHSNGTGRDMYIASDSGGIIKSSRPFSSSGLTSRPATSNSGRNVRYDGKVIHYHSDGTGRDNYIVCNEGGLARAHTAGKEGFFGTLRAYQPLKKYHPMVNFDYFIWAQRYQPKKLKDVETDREHYRTLKDSIERLSKPKTFKVKTLDPNIARERKIIKVKSAKLPTEEGIFM